MENDNLEETTDELDTDLFEEETPEVIPPEEPTEPTEDVAELKKKLATAEAQKDHWKKKATVKKDTPVSTDLSSKDLYAMITDKVPQEDVDEVIKASKALGISIPDALKSEIVKGILSDKAEKRKTAEVANTDNTTSEPTETTADELLKNAAKGDLPEDDEGIAKLIAAKLN